MVDPFEDQNAKSGHSLNETFRRTETTAQKNGCAGNTILSANDGPTARMPRTRIRYSLLLSVDIRGQSIGGSVKSNRKTGGRDGELSERTAVESVLRSLAFHPGNIHKEIVLHMKILTRGLTVGAISLVGLLVIVGCSSREEKVTTMAVPPPEVVVQPAPVIVSPPPHTVTEKTTTERSADDSVDNTGGDTAQQRSSSYHSETTTVTPAAPPPVVNESTTTTYDKKTYESNR
jgi:hypothetical protein